MSTSTDPDQFFQTTQSLAATTRKAAKSKNKNGSPIPLSSKILAVIADPTNADAVYVAESAGTARRVNLETSDISRIYRGPTDPLTSLALSPLTSTNPEPTTLYSGSWDKTIWSWSTSTGAATLRFRGHTDFVKTVLTLNLNNTPILLSGSADAAIIIWNASTGSKLFTLKGSHTRGILSLALDPATSPPDDNDDDDKINNDDASVTIFAASSSPEIRRWSLKADLSSATEIQPENPIRQHETSVNALHFDEDLDLWTASADGTAKRLSRERGWEVDTILPHGEGKYVRDVTVDETGGRIVTVGRDEEVRVWEEGPAELWHTYSGHFEEVTACVLLRGQRVVSVGIDRTVRVWSLRGEDLQRARNEAEDKRNGVLTEKAEGSVEVEKGMLTEEEERELAELMENDC